MIQEHFIKVAMADLRIVRQFGILKTTGLGSCVGITLYDPVMKIAGMAHIMLPSSEITKQGMLNPAKYADTAIIAILEEMQNLGASPKRIEAKLAGGAQMFIVSGQSNIMRIGPRNVESCKAMLKQCSIQLKAEDTGGHYG